MERLFRFDLAMVWMGYYDKKPACHRLMCLLCKASNGVWEENKSVFARTAAIWPLAPLKITSFDKIEEITEEREVHIECKGNEEQSSLFYEHLFKCDPFHLGKLTLTLVDPHSEMDLIDMLRERFNFTNFDFVQNYDVENKTSATDIVDHCLATELLNDMRIVKNLEFNFECDW